MELNLELLWGSLSSWSYGNIEVVTDILTLNLNWYGASEALRFLRVLAFYPL